MKKYLLIFIGILLTLTGCGTGDTITDHPRNHIYGPNKVINIYDNVDTGELIGQLRIVSVNVLSEGPIYISEATSYDADYNPIYTDVEYSQLIQINYIYENLGASGNSIGSYNFTVRDSNNRIAISDPVAEYTIISIAGVDSFVVATSNQTSSLNIEFNYHTLQFEPTAIIHINTSDNEIGDPIYNDLPVEVDTTTNQVNNQLLADQEAQIQTLTEELSKRDEEIHTLTNNLSEQEAEKKLLSDKLREQETELEQLKERTQWNAFLKSMVIIFLSLTIIGLILYIVLRKNK